MKYLLNKDLNICGKIIDENIFNNVKNHFNMYSILITDVNLVNEIEDFIYTNANTIGGGGGTTSPNIAPGVQSYNVTLSKYGSIIKNGDHFILKEF
jgi:hypothetical protein